MKAEDNEKILRKLEDIEAKTSQLEDRILTVELDFQELRTEFVGEEGAPTSDVLEKRLQNLEENFRKSMEDLGAWKDAFDNVTEKLSWLEQRISQEGVDIPEDVANGGVRNTVEELKNEVEKMKGGGPSFDNLNKRVDQLESMIRNSGKSGNSGEDIRKIVVDEIDKRIPDFDDVLKELKGEITSLEEKLIKRGRETTASRNGSTPETLTKGEIENTVNSLLSEQKNEIEMLKEEIEARDEKLKKVVGFVDKLNREIKEIRRSSKTERKRPFVIE